MVRIFAVSIAVFFTGTGVLPLYAQTYPSKPVRLIIPFPPGGSNDIIGRLVATKLSDSLSSRIVVDNRGGAGGLMGVEIAAHANPDGYTLLLISSTYTINNSIHQGKLPYDPQKSFIPIAKLGAGPSLLGVYPGLPANSVKDLIALAKEQPKKLIFSETGVGTFPSMAAELFIAMADIDVVRVQFKGGGPAVLDTMGGHSHIHLGTLPTLISHVQSGKIKALGIGGSKRSKMLPDIPTISESGVPEYEAENWWGLVAPTGTPQFIVERLNKVLIEVLSLDEVQNLFQTQGAESDYLGPTEFGKLIETETAKWAKVIKIANIKLD